jgi:hypothetical protein
MSVIPKIPTLKHVVQHCRVTKSTLELALPDMVVGVDEAGRYNLSIASNHGDIFALKTMADINNAVALNQDVGVSKSDNIVFRIMLQDGAILKKNSSKHASELLKSQCQEQLLILVSCALNFLYLSIKVRSSVYSVDITRL